MTEEEIRITICHRCQYCSGVVNGLFYCQVDNKTVREHAASNHCPKNYFSNPQQVPPPQPETPVPYASEEDYRKRFGICVTCEYNVSGECVLCRCHLNAKLHLATSHCPISKWGPVPIAPKVE
jgi:hypothetical protein